MKNPNAFRPAAQAGMRMWPLTSALVMAGMVTALLGGCSMMDSNKAASGTEMQIRPVPLAVQGAKTPDAYYTLGKYYFYQGRLGQAKTAFLDAVKLDPHHVDALNGLGVIYDREGSYDAARKSYEAALLKDPQAAHVWANLGYSFILAGKNAESMAPLQKAVALDPSNTVARQHLAGVMALEITAVATAPAAAQEPAPVSATAAVAMAVPPSASPVASVVTAKSVAVAEVKPVNVPALQPSVTARVMVPEELAPEMAARQTEPQPSPVATMAEIKLAKVPALQPTVTASVVEPNKTAPELAARQAEPRPAPAPALQAKETVSQPQPVIASVIRQQPVSNAAAARQAPAAGGYAQSWVEPAATKVAVVIQPAAPEAKVKPVSVQAEAKHSGKLDSLRIEVSNGNGVAGMARAVSSGMSQTGLNVARITNARPFNKPRTLIVCRPELKAAAAELAKTMPAAPKIVLQDIAHRRVDMRVVLGADSALAWKEGPVGSNKLAGLSR